MRRIETDHFFSVVHPDDGRQECAGLIIGRIQDIAVCIGLDIDDVIVFGLDGRFDDSAPFVGVDAPAFEQNRLSRTITAFENLTGGFMPFKSGFAGKQPDIGIACFFYRPMPMREAIRVTFRSGIFHGRHGG